LPEEKPDRLSLARTRSALEAYDASERAYQAAVDAGPAGKTDRDYLEYNRKTDELLNAVELAGQKVGEAFADDTADRNARHTALLMRPCEWLRKLVQEHGGDPEKK
jgi:hypothetical protein